MFLGIFANAKQFMYRDESFLDVGNGSWTIAVIAILSLTLSVAKKHQWQWIPSVLAIADLGFILHRLQVEYLEMRIRMEKDAGDNYFLDLARSVYRAEADTYKIIPDAWIVIGIGILFIIASMLIKLKK